jgi:hypothetical protein
MSTYRVTDIQGARPGDQLPVLGTFASEQEASEYIDGLPDANSGRYAIDGPAGQEIELRVDVPPVDTSDCGPLRGNPLTVDLVLGACTEGMNHGYGMSGQSEIWWAPELTPVSPATDTGHGAAQVVADRSGKQFLIVVHEVTP